MPIRSVASLAIVLSGFLVPSVAHSDILIRYMLFLNGECVSAIHEDTNFTEQCRSGAATITHYQNGYASVFFNSDTPISFIGDEAINPSKDNFNFKIIRATVSVNGQPFITSAAGYCSIVGDIEGNATIECAAELEEKGRYAIKYESKGLLHVNYGVGFEPFDIEKNITYAVSEFDRIYRSSGIDGVEGYLTTCYPAALESKQLPAIIKCAAIDYCGNWMDELVTITRGVAPRSYFLRAAIDERIKMQFEAFGSAAAPGETETIISTTRSLSIEALRTLIKTQAERTANKPMEPTR